MSIEDIKRLMLVGGAGALGATGLATQGEGKPWEQFKNRQSDLTEKHQ